MGQEGNRIDEGRRFLKANWDELERAISDQSRGVPMPPLSKPVPPGADIRRLPDSPELAGVGVTEAILGRRSRRSYLDDPLTLRELSYLLAMTARIQRELGRGSLRPAPSGGARHAIETYLAIHRVEGIEPGLYRYLPGDHSLIALDGAPEASDLKPATTAALHGQSWNSAVDFLWTAIPYRMEWRYSVVAHKIIALDAGHLCQNLYLACEAIGCGTCAIGAYDQEALDALLGVDGNEEFAIYAAPVGKVGPKREES